MRPELIRRPDGRLHHLILQYSELCNNDDDDNDDDNNNNNSKKHLLILLWFLAYISVVYYARPPRMYRTLGDDAIRPSIPCP